MNSFLKKIKVVSSGAAMADLAMLLLIFFMSSTTSEPPKGVEVKLPKAQTEGAEQDSFYISVSADGKYYFESREVDLDEISDNLAMRSGEKDRIISITADKNLPYEKIQKLLDILKSHEFLNVVFMAESRESGDSP